MDCKTRWADVPNDATRINLYSTMKVGTYGAAVQKICRLTWSNGTTTDHTFSYPNGFEQSFPGNPITKPGGAGSTIISVEYAGTGGGGTKKKKIKYPRPR